MYSKNSEATFSLPDAPIPYVTSCSPRDRLQQSGWLYISEVKSKLQKIK